MSYSPQKLEKITVTIPLDMKEKLNQFKKEYGITMSAIYKEALREYIKQKEQQKWEKAVTLMQKEYETNQELSDWVEFEEDMYDYKAV